MLWLSFKSTTQFSFSGDCSKSYLVSERMFRDLISSYGRAMPVELLSDGNVALIHDVDAGLAF